MIGLGTVLAGRYRLDQVIGRGATAQVFLATDLALSTAHRQRRVAIKLLHLALAGLPSEELFRADFFFPTFFGPARFAADFFLPRAMPFFAFFAFDFFARFFAMIVLPIVATQG